MSAKKKTAKKTAKKAAPKKAPKRKGHKAPLANAAAILGFKPAPKKSNSTYRPMDGVKIKTEWKKYYDVLMDLRDHLLHQMGDIKKESAEEMSGYSMHMADSGTDNFDRDSALSLLSYDQDAVYEIEEALKRIERKTFGTCEISGKAIPKGRLNAIPCVVISNNSASEALKRAGRESVPAYHLSQTTHPSADDLDKAVLNVLDEHRVNLVVLAGYMKRLGSLVLGRYPGRVLNIHPALLPKFGGKGMYGTAVHEAVLAAGETECGATVHLGDEEYDHGPVLAQKKVAVLVS